jgi:hypothetical protein
MRTRRLDASALGAIGFRSHLNSLPAVDSKSGRTENAREIPARSFRRAFSVRLRIMAADGERRNTGNYVCGYVRYRTQDTGLFVNCALRWLCGCTASRVLERAARRPRTALNWKCIDDSSLLIESVTVFVRSSRWQASLQERSFTRCRGFRMAHETGSTGKIACPCCESGLPMRGVSTAATPAFETIQRKPYVAVGGGGLNWSGVGKLIVGIAGVGTRVVLSLGDGRTYEERGGDFWGEAGG